MAAESMYKAYLASTLRGAFGSSAERKGPTAARESREQPGPAHYHPPIATACNTAAPRGRVIRATSNFASHSERIKKPEHLVCAGQCLLFHTVLSLSVSSVTRGWGGGDRPG